MNNSNIFTDFKVNMMDLLIRFDNGSIGNAFNSFITDGKTIEIFEENVYIPLIKKVQSIQDANMRERARLIINKDSLLMNFTMHLAGFVFQEALNEWVEDKGTFENIIIKSINIQNAEILSHMLREAYEHTVEDEIEMNHAYEELKDLRECEYKADTLNLESLFNQIEGLKWDDNQ